MGDNRIRTGCSKRPTVRLMHGDGKFKRWISPEERDAGIADGSIHEVYEERVEGNKTLLHFVGWTDEDDSLPGSAKNSPACLTVAETLAALGLSRFPSGLISRGRQASCQAKIKEFGENPSWMYKGREEGYGEPTERESGDWDDYQSICT